MFLNSVKQLKKLLQYFSSKPALLHAALKSTSVFDKVKSITGNPEPIALVTGGAEGIGLAFVHELIKNGVKAITVADINDDKGKKLEAALNKDGVKLKFIKTDVTNPAHLEGAFKATIDEFKAVNLVLINAGILNDKEWELLIRTNVTHFVRGCLLAIKYMGKNNGHKGGIVVNNASILGLQPFHGSPVYTGSKHFVIGLTRSLGTPYFFNLTNIEYMAICPGVTMTPLIEEARKFALDVVGPSTAEELVKGLGALPKQTTEDCAKSLIKIINEANNGGIWVSEGAETYEVVIPARQTMRK